MGVMSKFKKVRASGGAFKYFEEGEHYVRVNSVKKFMDRKENESVAFDAEIMSTTNPNMIVGEVRNWMVSEKAETADVYAPNVKALLIALHNMKESEMDGMDDAAFEELCDLTWGETQSCAGVVLKVTSVKQRKKHAKKKAWEECTSDDVYTRHAFEFAASDATTFVIPTPVAQRVVVSASPT
jgi:hypothetical protein